MPFRHRIYTRDYVPEHLEPSEKERGALADSGVGPLKGDALTMVKKIGQLFQGRRFLVGHLFDIPDSSQWHFLYCDQRDLQDNQNHWKEGAHVHLINWLLRPQADAAEALWLEFTTGNEPPRLRGALHIRFAADRRSAEP